MRVLIFTNYIFYYKDLKNQKMPNTAIDIYHDYDADHVLNYCYAVVEIIFFVVSLILYILSREEFYTKDRSFLSAAFARVIYIVNECREYILFYLFCVSKISVGRQLTC